MKKMRFLLAIFIFGLGCTGEVNNHPIAETSEDEFQLVIDRGNYFESGIKSITAKIGEVTYSGDWTIIIDYEGELDGMPDDIETLKFEPSPIVFSNDQSSVEAKVRVVRNYEPDPEHPVTTFDCQPFHGASRVQLARRSVYYFDSGLRRIVNIGKFSAGDDLETVRNIAKSAITEHIEQGDADQPTAAVGSKSE